MNIQYPREREGGQRESRGAREKGRREGERRKGEGRWVGLKQSGMRGR